MTGTPSSSRGGSLPTNVEWDENVLSIHEAADSGPLTPILFRLKTLLSGGLELSVRIASYFTSDFTTYNDNGNELFESDSLANGGDGEVRISGVPFVPQEPTFPVSLADGESVQFLAAGDPSTIIGVSNSGGVLLFNGDASGVSGFELSTAGAMILSGANVFTVTPPVPEIPAVPTAQDVTDALVALNLATQAA